MNIMFHYVQFRIMILSKDVKNTSRGVVFLVSLQLLLLYFNSYSILTTSTTYFLQLISKRVFHFYRQSNVLKIERWLLSETKYSRMDQVKFVEYSLEIILSDMICFNRTHHFNFLKVVFHKFYLVHSGILCFSNCKRMIK